MLLTLKWFVTDLSLFHLQGCLIYKYVVFIMISGSCDNGIFAYTQMYQMLKLPYSFNLFLSILSKTYARTLDLF